MKELMVKPFSKKCEILHDFYLDYATEYKEFIFVNDIGVPLATLVTQGCAIPTTSGVDYVEAAYEALCNMLHVDSSLPWNSIQEMMQ